MDANRYVGNRHQTLSLSIFNTFIFCAKRQMGFEISRLSSIGRTNDQCTLYSFCMLTTRILGSIYPLANDIELTQLSSNRQIPAARFELDDIQIRHSLGIQVNECIKNCYEKLPEAQVLTKGLRDPIRTPISYGSPTDSWQRKCLRLSSTLYSHSKQN